MAATASRAPTCTRSCSTEAPTGRRRPTAPLHLVHERRRAHGDVSAALPGRRDEPRAALVVPGDRAAPGAVAPGALPHRLPLLLWWRPRGARGSRRARLVAARPGRGRHVREPDDLAARRPVGRADGAGVPADRQGEWPWSFFCYLEDAPRPVTPSAFRLLEQSVETVAVAVGCPACGSTTIVVSRQVGHADPNITAQFNAHLIADERLDAAAAPFAEPTTSHAHGSAHWSERSGNHHPLRERDLGDLTRRLTRGRSLVKSQHCPSRKPQRPPGSSLVEPPPADGAPCISVRCGTVREHRGRCGTRCGEPGTPPPDPPGAAPPRPAPVRFGVHARPFADTP